MAGAAWYRYGSVTVVQGSPIVVGIATAFLSQVHIGDAFTLDGSKFYEIESVEDDTHLTLHDNFAEAGASNATYGILRNFNTTTNAALAAQLTALLASWQTREDQFRVWANGVPTGGATDATGAGATFTAGLVSNTVGGNGYYPLSDATGATVWYKCPAAQAILSGDSDKVDGFHASQTPAASQIPVVAADSSITFPGALRVNTTTDIASGYVSILYDQAAKNGLVIGSKSLYNATPLGALNFAAQYNSAGNYRNVAAVIGVKENAADGDSSGYLIFNTNGNTTNPTERMRITSSGNVGIGIANPSTKLYVVETKTDSSAQCSTFSSGLTQTAAATLYAIGVNSYATSVAISTGVTNPGYAAAVVGAGYISAANHQGTLAKQYGVWARSGINVAGVGGRVTNSYAVYAEILNGSANGTIDNAYGVFIDNQGTTGTITNRWGLFQAGSAIKNFFNGTVLVGNSTDNVSGALVQVAGTISATGLVLPSGAYTGTATGLTTSPTGTVKYTKIHNVVHLTIPALSGVSNATSFTITGGPAEIRPVSSRYCPCRIVDNGATSWGMVGVGTDGTLFLYKDAQGASFTASGTKATGETIISYIIS